MKRWKLWGAFLIFFLLFLKPEEAVSSAQNAMRVWYSSVAPTLFPFLVLMPLLTGKEACAAYERLFSGWMRPLLRLPGATAPAMIAAMIAGSPGGAITLRRVAANARLSRGELRRMALALGGVSPAYLIVGVGLRLHGSLSLGIQLAAAQAAVQLLMLILMPTRTGDHEKPVEFGPTDKSGNENPIRSAVESILVVCGYMVFYSVAAGILAGIAGKGIGDGLLLAMDLPSGMAMLAKYKCPMRIALQGAAIGFSGMCIISQNMNALANLGVEWKAYLKARLCSAGLMALACMLMHGQEVGIKGSLGGDMKINYAISLLIAGILILPALYLFSKKIFLNKEKGAELSE